VNDRLTPYNWLFIQHAEVDIDGYISEKMKTAEPIPFMSRRCNLKS
jgi:hypothetical protein